MACASLAPTRSAFGLPFYVARHPPAPFCETPFENGSSRARFCPTPRCARKLRKCRRSAPGFAGAIDLMTDEEKDEQFYRDTESIAHPKLDDRQLALLEPLGKRRTLQRGEFIFKAGQRDLGLTVILRGETEVFEAREGREQILATGRERDFIGDVAMLQGTSALATARVKSEEAEILEVPAAEIRRALAELPGLGGPIVNA